MRCNACNTTIIQHNTLSPRLFGATGVPFVYCSYCFHIQSTYTQFKNKNAYKTNHVQSMPANIDYSHELHIHSTEDIFKTPTENKYDTIVITNIFDEGISEQLSELINNILCFAHSKTVLHVHATTQEAMSTKRSLQILNNVENVWSLYSMKYFWNHHVNWYINHVEESMDGQAVFKISRTPNEKMINRLIVEEIEKDRYTDAYYQNVALKAYILQNTFYNLLAALKIHGVKVHISHCNPKAVDFLFDTNEHSNLKNAVYIRFGKQKDYYENTIEVGTKDSTVIDAFDITSLYDYINSLSLQCLP